MQFFVQPRDILYRLSLYILYTPVREARVGVGRWYGRRWTFTSNEFDLQSLQRRGCSHSAFCSLSWGSRVPQDTCGCDAIRNGRARDYRASRRPLFSPRRTDARLEQRVVQVRLRYPDWSARKLRIVLLREGVNLPRNTIHRILLRHGLVREEDHSSPAVQRFERKQPNELWQMDFKGPKGWPEPVGPLSFA